ncbi:ATP-binding protein [Vibrio chagasii]|nr:ATP-binding protein [Vibrio chagasii]
MLLENTLKIIEKLTCLYTSSLQKCEFLMLYQYKSRSKTYNFSSLQSDSDENIFSILVGKNGTGKSRLFKAIIHNLLNNDLFYHSSSNHLLPFKNFSNERLHLDLIPKKIIAVSTSPFDKFPIPNRTKQSDFLPVNYSYLGLRGLGGAEIGESYMANVIASLMTTVSEQPHKYDSISEILHYLGYTDRFDMVFSMQLSKSRLTRIIEDPFPERALEEYLRSYAGRIIDRSYFYDELNHLDIDKMYKLIRCIVENQEILRSKFRMSLSNRGIHVDNFGFLSDIFNGDILFLIKAGIVRLKQVNLEKLDTGKLVRFSEASSGEQAVVMSILGIASRIEDDSMIFIDEPEICLHPEWQEKYISLLISTFRIYKRCHFLIATHSPQIVSNLENHNCFVTSMDDGLAVSGFDVANKSIDFQLATTFKSPGHKNEYLSREILTLLTKFGQGEKITLQEIDLANDILELRETLDDDDPVKRLISMLQDVLSVVEHD